MVCPCGAPAGSVLRCPPTAAAGQWYWARIAGTATGGSGRHALTVEPSASVISFAPAMLPGALRRVPSQQDGSGIVAVTPWPLQLVGIVRTTAAPVNAHDHLMTLADCRLVACSLPAGITSPGGGGWIGPPAMNLVSRSPAW